VSLVLDDKWHAALRARVAEEVNALAFTLVGRLRELGVRYADTLDDLETASAALQQRVARHLAEMGVG
jgi:type I restriction enzyme M protein